MGNFLLLAIPAFYLLLVPEKAENLPGSLRGNCRSSGLNVGFFVAAAAIGWDVSRRRPDRIMDVIGAVLLGIGSLAACEAARCCPCPALPGRLITR